MSEKRTSTDKFNDEDGMPLRINVLHIALMVEKKAKWAIDVILPFTEEEARSITNLSFNQRIEFLTDLNVFNKKEKEHFGWFQSIRNKLVHNLDANTLEKCFQIMKQDPERTLLRDYPQDKSLSMEERLWNAMQKLIDDIGKSLSKIEPYVKERIDKKSAEVAVLKGLDVGMITMLDVMAEITGELVQRVNSGKPMTVQEVVEIPALMSKRVIDRIEKATRDKFKTEYGLDLGMWEAKWRAEGEHLDSL